jgi:hypothetical protein
LRETHTPEGCRIVTEQSSARQEGFDKISDKISVEANGTRRDSVLTLCLGDQELHIMDASSNIRLCKTKKMPFLIEMSLSHGQASITNYIIAQ